MLSVKLICVGKMKERFYLDAFAEYRKRLQSLCRLELVEPAEQRLPENPSQAEITAALEKEGQEILVANNLVSVRDDVEMQVDTSAIAAINMPVDFNELGENLQNYLNDFNKIFNK